MGTPNTDPPAGGNPKPLKRVLPRGALAPRSWELIKAEQAQSGFGWTAVWYAAAFHALVLAGLFVFNGLRMWSPLGALAAWPLLALGVAWSYRGLENLVHGAAHLDLCRRDPHLNDRLANCFIAYSVGQTVQGFRTPHLEGHHAAFGGPDDQCARRMRARGDVSEGNLPGFWQTLRRTPIDALDFFVVVGAKPVDLLRALAWQVAMVFAPVAFVLGTQDAVIAYVALMLPASGLILPALRALAEAGEHDYAAGPEDAIIGRTFDNIGFLNGLLHPVGDRWHVLHHLAPGVPQARLGRLMRTLVETDPDFARYARRRCGVLTAPAPYLETPPKPSRKKDVSMDYFPHVVVAPDVRRAFPGIGLHGLVCSLSGRSMPPPAQPATLWSDLDAERLAEHPAIAPWRAAIRQMGLKATEHRSSVEQLVRRWIRGAPPSTQIPLVDTYNIASAEEMTPLGVYDAAKISTAPVELRFARPGQDAFDPIGGNAERFPVSPQVVVYANADQILSWGFNVRDSAVTAVRPETRTVLVLSEFLDARGSAASLRALDRVRRAIEACGGVALRRFDLEPSDEGVSEAPA